MKIFLIEPLEGGSVPIVHYCLRAFAQMGHDVRFFRGTAFSSVLNYIKAITAGRPNHPLTRLFPQFLSNVVQQQIEEISPHIVFAVSQSPIFPRNLSFCRTRKIITICWFTEDCNRFLSWQHLAPHFDFFFIIQKEPILSAIRRLCNQVEYLALAADPEIHCPTSLTNHEKLSYGSAVSFVGAGYPNRIHLFKSLIDYDLKIWGNDWNLEKIGPLKTFVQEDGRRISVEKYVKIFNASAINLNLHSSMNPNGVGGDFVNPRTFEISACRAFQLVDKRGLLGELFSEEEIVTFSSIQELRMLIERFLSNHDERKEYAERAYKKVILHHTYGHRIRELMKIVCSRG